MAAHIACEAYAPHPPTTPNNAAAVAAAAQRQHSFTVPRKRLWYLCALLSLRQRPPPRLTVMAIFVGGRYDGEMFNASMKRDGTYTVGQMELHDVGFASMFVAEADALASRHAAACSLQPSPGTRHPARLLSPCNLAAAVAA